MISHRRFAVDAVRRCAPLRTSRLRISTAAQSGVRPHQSAVRTPRRGRRGTAPRRTGRWSCAIISGVCRWDRPRSRRRRPRRATRAASSARRARQTTAASCRPASAAARPAAARRCGRCRRRGSRRRHREDATRASRRRGYAPRLGRPVPAAAMMTIAALSSPHRPHQRGVAKLGSAALTARRDRAAVARRRHSRRAPPPSAVCLRCVDRVDIRAGTQQTRTIAALPCSAAM